MADNTGISWTHATWNIFVGCSPVSKACKRCYAMSEAWRQIIMAKGLGRTTHYEGTARLEKGRAVFTGVVNLAPENIRLRPIAWTRPRLIFVNSVSDVFHENVSDAWVDLAMSIAVVAGRHVFQVLTKRPDRMAAYFARLYGERWEEFLALRPPVREGQAEGPRTVREWLVEHYGTAERRLIPNLWLGTTVEDARRADERIPALLSIPATVLWVSMEPLLSDVDLTRIRAVDGRTIDALRGTVDRVAGATGRLGWVVTGGESGPGARPMHPAWVERIDADCAAAGVPHHFKQWGAWIPSDDDELDAAKVSFVRLDGIVERRSAVDGAVRVANLGKRRTGRLLGGAVRDAMPEDVGRLAA